MTICIIPARGGSKRIPNKNVRLFCGKPIIAYAIEAAIEAGCFDEVMVSTDNDEIAERARQHGAKVPFLRSAESASDVATTVSVWQEVLRAYENEGKKFDLACSILPTAPFVTATKLRAIMNELELHPEWDAAMPVVPYSPPIQRAMGIEDGTLRMIWPEYRSARSQDLEPRYHDAGQYYAFRTSFIRDASSLRDGRLGAIVVPGIEAQDIDTEEDWELAEMKFQRLRKCT